MNFQAFASGSVQGMPGPQFVKKPFRMKLLLAPLLRLLDRCCPRCWGRRRRMVSRATQYELPERNIDRNAPGLQPEIEPLSSDYGPADDSSGLHHSSPWGGPRTRGRHYSGGSDDSGQVFLPTSVQEPGQPSRSEIMTSVYGAAGRYGTVVVTGEAQFGLLYNPKTGMLKVHVKQCRNLAPVKIKKNRSDPYVKVHLLPDRTKSGKQKTKVKKNNLNPVFDEVLKFRVTMNALQARVLWLSVWHRNIFGRNDFLGEVILQLSECLFKPFEPKWYPLQERRESLEMPLSYRGDLLLSLKYVPPDVTTFTSKQSPARGSLHILVKEACNLKAARSDGTADPFCKSYLLPDRSKGGKQRTPVVKKTRNPKWNHTFIYRDVSLESLKDSCLELTLWHYKYTSNNFLGGVRLGTGIGKALGAEVDWMDSQGQEVILWRAMLEQPNTWVEGKLHLRPNIKSKR